MKRPIYLANWSLVTRSRKLRGLGVKDLTQMNNALMIKWMWLWVQQDQAWWKETTVTLGPHIRPWEMPNASRFWSSLTVLAPIFDSSVQYQLGQGVVVQFWHDAWVQSPLKIQFPHLYTHARYRDGSVANHYQHGEWQLYLIEQLNTQARAKNDLLQQSLSAIQLSQARDIPQWSRNSSATFTTKSAYRFITDTPYMEEDLFKLWEIKIPLRVQVFLWLMLRNRLLTIDNMIKRGWVIVSICYLCWQQLETTHHIFHECSYVKRLIDSITDAIPLVQQFCPVYKTTESAKLLITDNHDMFWRQMEATIVFIVWRERCRHIFAEKSQSVLDTTQEIIKKHKQWFLIWIS
jgi:zinc-binding in reverse transcriptase